MKLILQIILLYLLLLIPQISAAQEICSNGIDDDSDGLIDLNDPDCACNAGNVSLLANASFESNTGCPSTFKQFNLVNNWVSGNSEAIDYLNTCGFTRYTGVAFPDGNGIAGCFYLEDRLRYIGQCLSSPLTSGISYTLKFDVSAISVDNAGNQLDLNVGGLCGFNYNSFPYPFTVALYGTSNCGDLPWSGTGSPIGSGSWVLLGQVTYNPVDTLWEDLTITFTPSTNIAAIAVGPPTTQISQFPIYNEGGNGNIGCFPFIQYDEMDLNQSSMVTDVEIASAGGYCTNDFELTASSNIAGGTWQWYKNGIALAGETNANLLVSAHNHGTGTYVARYMVNGNCYTEYYLLLPPHPIDTDYTTGTSCLVNIVAFTDLSFGGLYNITNWDWDFGDGNTSTDQNPVHKYNSNGTYNAKLVVTTNDGCKDSVTKVQTVNKPTPLYDTTCSCSGLGISLIPNHSFEDHSCCPTNFSQLNCADTWIQASDATSDYWNTCGTIDMTYNPPLPPPDGNGFAGFIDWNTSYKEYIGACLIEPMHAGQTYNLTFQMASTLNANFAFWGATSCSDLPFSGDQCPQGIGSWQILQQQNITLGGGTWHTVSMSLTLSQDIYAVLLGPDCGSGPGGIGYYYVDNLSLSSSFLQPIDIQGSYCTDNIILKSGPATDTFQLYFQWFKNGVELIGETDSILNVSANGYGIGDYQIMGVYRDGCDISPKFHVDSAYIHFTTETVTSCPDAHNAQISLHNITGQGNTPPYTFQLNNNAPITDSTFTNLYPGTYRILVRDSLGCMDSAMVTVDSLSSPHPLFTFSDVCSGDSVLFTGQTSISTDTINSWLWHFGDADTSSNQNPHHLYSSDGLYNVTLTLENNHGCRDSLTDTVRVFMKPTVNAGSDQTICYGSSTLLSGSIGGDASSAAWSNGLGTYLPNNTTLNASYSAATSESNNGTVSLILTTNDPTGPCNAVEDTVVITVNPLPTVSAGSDQTICSGDNVLLAATFGGAATSGTWSGGNGTYTPDNTTATAVYTPTTSEANSGSITLTYTTDDPAGSCTSVNDDMVIIINQPATANAGSTQYVCTGATLNLAGTIGGTASSGSWSGGSGTYNPSNTSLNAIYTPTSHEYDAGTLTLTLTTNDPQGPCPSSSSDVTMNFYPLPIISFLADNPKGCPIHCTSFSNSSHITTPETISSWDWNFGDGGTSSAQNPYHCFVNPGFYNITLTATSNHSCSSSLLLPQHVEVYNVPTAEFTPNPNPASVLEPNVIFTNQSSSDVTYWHWDFGDGDTLAPNVENPTHIFASNNNVFSEYPVVLIVHNAHDCYDTVMHEIIVNPEFSFFIPNAFSPNNDGVNDFFYGSGIGIITYDLWIFDRWGNMIFHSDELSKGWDGKANDGQNEAQIDVYVWKVKLTDIFNKDHSYIGTVTLVK